MDRGHMKTLTDGFLGEALHKMKPAQSTKNYKGKVFPGGSVLKNPSPSAEDIGSVPDQGRSHMPLSS